MVTLVFLRGLCGYIWVNILWCIVRIIVRIIFEKHHELQLMCITSAYVLSFTQLINLYFWIKYYLDRSTMHPKLDPTGVRTHDHRIITVRTFHVTEMPALTTWPSATSTCYVALSPSNNSHTKKTRLCKNYCTCNDFDNYIHVTMNISLILI